VSIHFAHGTGLKAEGREGRSSIRLTRARYERPYPWLPEPERLRRWWMLKGIPYLLVNERLMHFRQGGTVEQEIENR